MQKNTAAQITPVRSHRAPSFFPVQVPAMLLLFCIAAVYEAIHLSSLVDPDVWWHLSTGLWILKNHAAPHNGLFSQYSNLPWVASSWGYDVLLAVAYKLLGLRAIPVTLMAIKVALAVSAFWLARSLSRNFWLALFLAIVAQCALPPLRPIPNLLSIVCFAIELALLFESRRKGNVRLLFWLPLLFVFWANLHIQFVYGLIVLVLLVAAALTEHICLASGATWCESPRPAMATGPIVAVTALSFAATLLTPYTYHIYEVIMKNARPVAYIAEEHAMNFRQPQHYVLLLLAMGAFLALGRRRSRDLFKLAILIACSMVAFRIQGDAGFLALASVAVIGDAFSTEEIRAASQMRDRFGRGEILLTAVLVAVVLLVAASRIPSTQEMLLNRIDESFPVRASDYIRDNRLANPLFNEYQWGGFLTFYLPGYPVAIDGRTDLYGDAIIKRYFAVTNAELPLDADPAFADAQTILLPADSGMAVALATMPNFKMVYRDNLAMVLVRQM